MRGRFLCVGRRLAPLLVLLPLAGCGSSGIQAARDVVDSAQALVDLFTSVQDPASAQAAIPQIDPAYQQFSTAYGEFIAAMAASGQVTGTQSEVDELESKIDRLGNEVERQHARLESIAGLPTEFWSAIRVADARASVALVQAVTDAAATMLGVDPTGMGAADDPLNQKVAAYETHGPERVAEVTIRGGREYDHDAAADRFRSLSGASVIVIPDLDGTGDTQVLVAPVPDMQAFHDAVDFGTVIEFYPERCGLVLEVTEELAGPYAGMTAEEIAQQKQRDAEQAAADAQRKQEEEQRLADQRAREEAEQQRRAREEEMRKPPTPGTPDYFAKLLANAADPQAPHHALSLAQLTEADPADAPDDATRAQVVAALGELAGTARSNYSGDSEGNDAVRAYVRWAGAAAVPTLVELVGSAGGSIDQAVLDGLAQYPTVEGVEALAARIEQAQQLAPISEALGRMGPVAEEPLLALIPADQAEVNIAVLNALGQCGTKASLRIMRQAAKSENDEVAQAARDAAAAIRERAKSAV